MNNYAFGINNQHRINEEMVDNNYLSYNDDYRMTNEVEVNNEASHINSQFFTSRSDNMPASQPSQGFISGPDNAQKWQCTYTNKRNSNSANLLINNISASTINSDRQLRDRQRSEEAISSSIDRLQTNQKESEIEEVKSDVESENITLNLEIEKDDDNRLYIDIQNSPNQYKLHSNLLQRNNKALNKDNST